MLEVSRDATSPEIKRAYRKMAEDYHPDKTMHLGLRLRELAELEMKRINKAKEVLMDDEKRKLYDEYLDGKRTEDLEDIVMDVDPFQGFEEANWEELKEEILEVEPLEDTADVAEAEVVPDEHVQVQEQESTHYIYPPDTMPRPERSAPTRLPFWKRVKATVASYDTSSREQKTKRRRGGAAGNEWSDGYQKFNHDRRERPVPQTEVYKEPVITPPPPPPPPPVPQQQRATSASRRKAKAAAKRRRKSQKKPTAEDIKINVITEFEDEQPEWDEYGYEYDYDYVVSDEPEYEDREDPKKKVYDFEQVDPIQMEIVDEKDVVDVRELHHKKHKSRLEGLEPKDDYEVKWTQNKKGERYRRKKKTDDLDDWERHKKRAEEQRDKRIGVREGVSKRVREGVSKRVGEVESKRVREGESKSVREGESKRVREGERKRVREGESKEPGKKKNKQKDPDEDFDDWM